LRECHIFAVTIFKHFFNNKTIYNIEDEGEPGEGEDESDDVGEGGDEGECEGEDKGEGDGEGEDEGEGGDEGEDEVRVMV